MYTDKQPVVGLLQECRSLTSKVKGGLLLFKWRWAVFRCVCGKVPASSIAQSRKKPTVQPPSAFVMLPHGGTHWMRKKLGKSVLRTQARSTAFSLAIADSDIPSGELATGHSHWVHSNTEIKQCCVAMVTTYSSRG